MVWQRNPSVKVHTIAAKCEESGVKASPPLNAPEFDYIIVGGGTAGCVLAKRLTESQASVLVLERGQLADTFQSRAPLLSLPYSGVNPGVMQYNSVPQKHFNDRPCKMISGKLLGGTSRINNGLYTRCQPAEFNNWGPEWTFEKVDPYYRRSECNVSSLEKTNMKGEWETKLIQPFWESSQFFYEIVAGMGVPYVKDVNDPRQPACSITKLRTTVTGDGKRCSTNYAFLPQEYVSTKQNLKICLGAVVQRLAIDEQYQVQGVYVETEESSNQTFYVRGKEVILCAGAVASPQILLLSGIGPKEELEKHHIPCKVDLPGKDHVSVPLIFSVPENSSIHVLQSRPLKAIKELLQYIFTGTGIFTSPVTEYNYFLRSDNYPPKPLSTDQSDSSRSENLADLEIAYVGGWGTIEQTPPGIKNTGYNTILVIITRPESKGTITLVDRDARNPPLVDPNYLASEKDLSLLRKGILCGMDIANKIMEKNENFKPALIPEEISSEESINEFIGKFAGGAYHLSSTCRMTDREKGGVVDQKLRVYGVKGLWIADASIFPDEVMAKPQATIVMIGERCSDFLLSL